MRVRRMTSAALGTIAEINGKIKVIWDGGQTSYFKRDVRANVQLELATPRRPA